MNQYVGYVVTQAERCLAFPNIYQHKVSSFELKDATKPGHRKILVFFLVDPTTPILSTAQIPPQQRSWYIMELKNLSNTYFSWLPKDAMDLIISYLDWPMTSDDAMKCREALMEERKFFGEQNTKEIFERPFSLCEH